MATEAQKRAAKRYDDKYTIMVPVKLNKRTDADIISHLQSIYNRQGYIKDLIRDDIKANKERTR